jgi:hypothetical protein
MKIPPVKKFWAISMKLTKKSVKGLDKGGEDFLYLLSKFLNHSHAKVEEDIFVGAQIRRVMFDDDFGWKIKSTESAARKSIH